MKKLLKYPLLCLSSAVVTAVSAMSVSSFADWKQFGYMGDLNNDKKLSVADLVIMTKHLLSDTLLTSENGYDVKGKIIGIGGDSSAITDMDFLDTADINQDGKVDVFDLVMLRKQIIGASQIIVWEWEDEVTQTTTTTTDIPQTTTSTEAVKDFISPPIYDLYGSLPSQGDANVAIFYVDFPDCKYRYMPSVSEIEDIAFGKADPSDSNYPFESMSAFYDRSSKGAMKLGGKAFTYTAKNNVSAYGNDVWHIDLVEEILAEFDATVDFSEFDGDGDKTIDAILISVPTSAGDDNWWPAAGVFGGNTRNRVDGMDIGHVIVGNAQIESADDCWNFNSSYLHEMGHCMGLPDYYLYGVEDFQGLHGSAGFELMDDAMCDFGALSKLMLGWYAPEQVNVYNKADGKQSFTLKSGQTNEGNCVIIPVGDLDKNYYSEFFIVEYSDLTGNNSQVANEWWRATGSGVRVYHAEATVTGDYWYNTFKYSSGNDEFTNNDKGKRFIRLVGEGTNDTDNFFRTGDTIDNNNSDFRSYDSNGKLTGDIGIKIEIGENNGDSYVITVSPN